jgi:hypothetical protein
MSATSTPKTLGDFWYHWMWYRLTGFPRDQFPDPPLPQDAPFIVNVGDELTCDEHVGVFRRCLCGSSRFRVAPGEGPHSAQLICFDCERGGRWLSSVYLEVGP